VAFSQANGISSVCSDEVTVSAKIWCRGISLELAAMSDELANQWDAIELTMAMVAAK